MTLFFECLAKTSLATALIWVITLLLQRRSAALRHALWLCSLAAFLLVPALLPLAQRTPAVRLAVAVPTALNGIAGIAVPSPAKRPSLGQLSKTQLDTRILRWTPLSIWPLSIWIVGSIVLSIRRLRPALRMQAIARRSQPAPAGLSSPHHPAIRVSAEVPTPLTWGLLRPLILLPSCALDWNPECLRSVLAHEREHIRRLDPLSHWFAELVCAVWWFNPFAWLARNRAAHERECACDDAVLLSGVRPTDYASELLNLAATLPIKGEPIMALSALSNFERRIRNLLVPGIDRSPSTTRTRLAIVLATLALIVPLALLRAQAPVGQADLSGTVLDPSGARVPNATIIATGSTGNREVTRANLAGQWTLPGIPAGDYKVEVRAPGFQLDARTVTLAPGQPSNLDQFLSLGGITENVKIVAQGQARTTPQLTNQTPKPIRVGGNVQATKVLYRVDPVYPESAKAQGIEGSVVLQGVIAKDGSLLNVIVINKLADPDLAAAALDAVKQWRYEPTRLNGEPVEVVTTMTVDFKLQN
jgi:TonB family protein